MMDMLDGLTEKGPVCLQPDGRGVLSGLETMSYAFMHMQAVSAGHGQHAYASRPRARGGHGERARRDCTEWSDIDSGGLCVYVHAKCCQLVEIRLSARDIDFHDRQPGACAGGQLPAWHVDYVNYRNLELRLHTT